MRIVDVEHWALRIADSIEQGQNIEDTRVELKTTWIEPKKAARRLAGHANAARGEPILWLIGINEGAGKVVGAPLEELANWWPSVKSQFDEGVAPTLSVSVSVQWNSVHVYALYFETERAPYVIKNLTGSGPDREVPWRDGTGIRTAKRSDLVRLLVPVSRLPQIQVFDRGLTVSRPLPEHNHNLPGRATWTIDLNVYIVTPPDSTCIIPFHACEIVIEVGDTTVRIDGSEFHAHFFTIRSISGGIQRSPNTDLISASGSIESHQIVLSAPARLMLNASVPYEVELSSLREKDAKGYLSMAPLHSDGRRVQEFRMRWKEYLERSAAICRWA